LKFSLPQFPFLLSLRFQSTLQLQLFYQSPLFSYSVSKENLHISQGEFIVLKITNVTWTVPITFSIIYSVGRSKILSVLQKSTFSL
jgi:hypothetical protein